MKRLQQIFKIAEAITKSLMYSDRLNTIEIESNFNKIDAEEIVQRIQSKKEQKARVLFIQEIDKGKIKDWEKIQKGINKTKRVYYLKALQKLVAVLLISIGVYSYFQHYHSNIKTVTIALENSSEHVVLKLSNGECQIISSSQNKSIVDPKVGLIGLKSNEKLSYQDVKGEKIKELIYNELVIPYGKTFEVVLSDKTIVYLNSGSVFKYPIKFINGKKRQVFLEGEAYFKVSKDEKNSFVVTANNLDIRVLGTEFNVSSYPEDQNIFTVLVEGSVSLYKNSQTYTPQNSVLLEPGKRAKWNKNTNTIKIKRVDTTIYTSWIYGELKIEKLRFDKIIKKLERRYNVKIKNKNKELATQEFTATFQTETIQEVLESFRANYKFKYTKKGSTIIIN